MPFLEHLRDLRKMLVNSVIALLVAVTVAFYFADTLFFLLTKPLIVAWQYAGLKDPNLRFGSLTEPFWVYFTLSMYAGVFLASPVIFYQFWGFIAPGLHKREKRIALPFAICSAACFIGGALFCYFLVFPAAYKFFLSYTSTNLAEKALPFIRGGIGHGSVAIEPTLFMQQYLDITLTMLLGFGIVFEMPLLFFFLAWIGLVTHRGLWRFNRYAIVLCFIIGAILTPGPDIISQFLMATPMVVLYNISILVAYFVTKSREKRLARAAAGTNDPDDEK